MGLISNVRTLPLVSVSFSPDKNTHIFAILWFHEYSDAISTCFTDQYRGCQYGSHVKNTVVQEI